jgi:hypothetical protein
MMPDLSKNASVISAMAALVSSIAWPLVASIFLFAQRGHVSNILSVLVQKLEKARTIKAGGFEIADEIIEGAVEGVPIERDRESTSVPEAQVKSARTLKLNLQSAGVDIAEATRSARDQVHSLALEYENIRSSMGSGPDRTFDMNKIVAKMRTLALLTKPLIADLTSSNMAGERLAAIAALQVESDDRYAGWLAERIAVEQPFVFFNAAVALRQLVLDGRYSDKSKLKAHLKAALRTLTSFTKGTPDANTVQVLEDALHLIETAA